MINVSIGYRQESEPILMATNNLYPWITINVSTDTYQQLRKLRLRGESMNEVLRKLMDLPMPDPTRSKRKRIYYEEDK